MAAARLKLVVPSLRGLTTLQRFMLGSAIVHVTLAVAVFMGPSVFGRRAPFQDVTFVDLVAAPPGPSRPAASAPAPAPARPEPAPPDEGVRAEPEPPKPAPERVEPVKKSKPAETPRPTPAETPSGPPADAVAAPEADGLGPGLEAVADGNASIASDLGGTRDSWYRSQVIAALYGHWKRPPVAGAREIHEVTVSFEILRNGEVRDIRLEQSSGIRSLDRSALRAVGDASPLPPIPSSWRESRVPAVFVFRLHPDA